MNPLCPECMGILKQSNGDRVRCSIHHEEYKLLFARYPVPETNTGAVSFLPPENTDPQKVIGVSRQTNISSQVSTTKTLEKSVMNSITSLSDNELLKMMKRATEYRPEAISVAKEEIRRRKLDTFCINHSSVEADYQCKSCGAMICKTCAFPMRDGQPGHLCPGCATSKKAPLQPSSQSVPAMMTGAKCVNHPAIDAVQRCKACGAAVCQTCDFVFPGEIHVCPKCAATPQTNLSPQRKKRLIWSYILAVWTSIWMVILFSGALSDSVKSKSDLDALGLFISIVVLVPSIIGTSMAASTFERRMKTTFAIWGAFIWNGLLLAIFLLLCIIGIFS